MSARDTEVLGRLTAALADRYVFEHKLGQGGMGSVYLAQDLKHRRAVAFKVLRPEVAPILGVERFKREIVVVSTLQHPHILPLYDSGDVPGPGGAPPLLRDAVHRGGIAPRQARPGETAAARGGARASPGTWPARSTTPTATAWSTATSSRRTS